MKLITQEVQKLAKKYPLYSQDSKGDEAIVWLKFFDPCGRYTYFVTEMEINEIVSQGNQQHIEGTVFGYVISPLGPDCDELGYGDLQEMTTVKNRMGLGIERDMYFSPCTMGEIKRGEKS